MTTVRISGWVAIFALTVCVGIFAEEKPAQNAEALKAYDTGVYSQYIFPGKSTAPSQLLVDQMWDVTVQQFKEMPAEEKKFPNGTTEEDVLKNLRNRIPKFPCVQTTAEEDEKFKAGTFDDNRNFIAFMDFMKILTKNNIQIPVSLQILQRDQQKQNLKGPRLELAVRIAFMAIAKVYRSAEKK